MVLPQGRSSGFTGPVFIRRNAAAALCPEGRGRRWPTIVRILEEKGYVAHEVLGGSHRFHAVARKNDFRDRSLAAIIRDYFDNSYKSAVSALAEEEKISVEELREIIDLIEGKNAAK